MTCASRNLLFDVLSKGLEMKHAVSHLVIHCVTLVEALPPCTEVDRSGKISGYIHPVTKKFFPQQRQCVIRIAKAFFRDRLKLQLVELTVFVSTLLGASGGV